MNVKSLYFRLSLLLLVVILSTSCSKKTAYLQTIPAEATLVVSFDMESLATKSGLMEKEGQEKLKEMARVFMGVMDNNSQAFINQLMTDPEKSGLSFREKIYSFVIGEDYASTCILAKVRDQEDLKASLALFEKVNLTGKIAENGGCSWTLIGEEVLCVFDEEACLFVAVGASEVEAKLEQLQGWMKQEKEQSLISNKGFEKLLDKKADVGLFLSMNFMSSHYSQLFADLPNGTSIKDLMALCTLNFEKGKIAMQIESYTDNAIFRKQLEEHSDILEKLDEGYANYFPATILSYICTRVNGAKISEQLSTNEMLKTIGEQYDLPEIIKLVESLDGDVAVGLTNRSELDLPALTLYAEVKNDAALQYVLTNSNRFGATVKKNSSTDYVLNTPPVQLYIGMKDKLLYATTSLQTYQQIGQDVPNSLSKAAWAPLLEKSYGIWVVNVEELIKLPLVKAYWGSANQEILSALTYVDFRVASPTVIELGTHFKNDKENVLKLLVTELDRYLY